MAQSLIRPHDGADQQFSINFIDAVDSSYSSSSYGHDILGPATKVQIAPVVDFTLRSGSIAPWYSSGRNSYSNYSASQSIPSLILTTQTSEAVKYKSTSILTGETYGFDEKLFDRCRREFVGTARREQIEHGFASASEQLVSKYLSLYPATCGGILQYIYIKESHDTAVALALVRGISFIDYDAIMPYGQMIALAALTNTNDEVREAGIRAYERWRCVDGIAVLKTIETSWDWLEQYRLETIEYLESLRCLS